MAKKTQSISAVQILAERMAVMQAELDLWHKMYPRQVHGMREEARAKIEGREPRHLPPTAFAAGLAALEDEGR